MCVCVCVWGGGGGGGGLLLTKTDVQIYIISIVFEWLACAIAYFFSQYLQSNVKCQGATTVL